MASQFTCEICISHVAQGWVSPTSFGQMLSFSVLIGLHGKFIQSRLKMKNVTVFMVTLHNYLQMVLQQQQQQIIPHPSFFQQTQKAKMAASDRWTSMSQLETWQLASHSLPLPQFLQGFRLCLYVSKTSRCTRQYKGCVVDCPVEPTSVQPLCSIAFLIVMASCNLNALKYVLLLFYFQKR